MSPVLKFRPEGVPKSQKEDELDEDDKYLIMKEKIAAPLVWCRLASGFRVQDLKESHYNQALSMIKKYYMTESVLCKAVGLVDDFVGRRSFISACLFQMKDTTSLMLVDESRGKNKMAGICLLRAVAKVDFGRIFSRTILRNGEAHNKCIGLKTALNRKVDIYADYDCEIFLRVYSLCISPEYRSRGLGFELFRTAFRVARALNIPVIMGIFDCHKMQNYAAKLGFEVAAQIKYSDWKDEAGIKVFAHVGEKSVVCSLMVARVQPQPYPDFLIEKPAEPSPEEEEPKKTKKDKKADKKKGDKKKGKK